MPGRVVPGRIRARSRFNVVKIHGANSPQVLAGEVPLGHRETISDQVEQYIELDYDQAVEMFGQENADELFKGVKG